MIMPITYCHISHLQGMKVFVLYGNLNYSYILLKENNSKLWWPVEFFTLKKSDRSVRNKMQFLRIITIKILQLSINMYIISENMYTSLNENIYKTRSIYRPVDLSDQTESVSWKTRIFVSIRMVWFELIQNTVRNKDGLSKVRIWMLLTDLLCLSPTVGSL